MKTYLSPFIIVFLFLFSCNRDEFIAPGEGLSIQSGNKVVLNANEIDYYDLSTHFIYLKGTNSFLNDKLVRDSFQVYANGEKIYSGVFHAWYMSSIPIGPAIFLPQTFYEDYIVPITLMYYTDLDGKKHPPVDPRRNPHILNALKSYGQLHEGLSCEIHSVQINPGSNKVLLELKLTNNDTFDYFHLDPEKTGMGLFHYFTNGLSLWSPSQMKRYENHVQHIQPDPWDSWDMNWLSVIRSGETKIFRINYTNFDPVPAGQYKLQFSFPGLSHVERSELVQRNGRIWLGELDLSQDIQIR